ncbi:MAG: hypothetical protein LBI45_05745 [Bacteroidales bacterium]|jgi:hypothetical protein|nr:hypothetical protein [Bacteroidales bacterium]
MKKLLTISLLLLVAFAFTGCIDTKTTVVVKNLSDFQISDMIIFCYQGNDQVDQKNAGSLGVGSSSSPTEIASKIEKVAISFKFFIDGIYSVRYITVNKYLVNSNSETTITIENSTMVKYYSDSKAPGVENTEGFTIAKLRIEK